MSAKIIMVASGKGGTGKSTLSVLIGAALAARGKRVLLIELDSGLRSVDVIAGVCGKTVYDIEDILSGRCEADKAVVESPIYPRLSVVSAPYAGGDIRPDALRVLAGKMAEVFDFILLDTAAGMGAPFLAAKSVASMAIIVITPDLVTMRDGRLVADELLAADMAEIRLVINRVQQGRGAFNPVKNLDECIDTVGAQLLGVVPASQDIALACACGEALDQNTLEQRVLSSIAARILGEDAPLLVR